MHKAQVADGHSVTYLDEQGVERLAAARDKITLSDTKQFNTLVAMGAIVSLEKAANATDGKKA